MSKEIDKSQGCIVGAAIGDALGMPLEFLGEMEVKKHFGRVEHFVDPIPSHPSKHLKAGQWTDDTQLLLLMAESLIENKGFEIYDFAQRLAGWGKRCEDEKTYNRYAEMTNLKASRELRKGGDPQSTGYRSPSPGSVVRSIPIGIWYYRDIDAVVKYSTESSIPTHNSTEAKDSCLAVSLTCAYLLNGLSLEESIKSTLHYLSVKKLKKRLNQVIDMQDEEPEKVKSVIGISTKASEVLAFAFYAFLHAKEDFMNSVVTAVNVLGNADTTGAVAGALSGAYNGLSKIPADFTAKLEAFDLLSEMGRKLIERSNYLRTDFDLRLIDPEKLGLFDVKRDQRKHRQIMKILEKRVKGWLDRVDSSIQYKGLELGKEIIHHYESAKAGKIEICSVMKTVRPGTNLALLFVLIEDKNKFSLSLHHALEELRRTLE
jgi:ADP-ribosylglycohydrolase